MRFRTRLLSGVSWGVGKFLGITAVVALTVAFSAALGLAGDVTASSGNNLNVTGAPTELLPQTQGTENGWLTGLHVSGYGSQTFGMWQNPTTLSDWTPSRNNLAVSRSLLQVDENYRLNEDNSFFMREWFVYEPPYSFNSANAGPGTYTLPGHVAGAALYGTSSCPSAGGAGCASFGHFANGFYNQYTVRDAWWENKTGPLTTYIGNQIVVWGQSLAFRVGDVVNPQDTTWAFGFANLEQSRIPQWMLHPILNLPELGPLTSNFIEGIVVPRYDPMWNSNNYADGRYYNEMDVAGTVNNGFPSGVAHPGRFDAHFLHTYYPGRDAVVAPFNANGPFGPEGAGLVGVPIDNEFFWCNQLQGFLGKRTVNPVPAGARRNCNLGLKDGKVPFGPTGSGALVDIGNWNIPASTVQNWEEGVRLHTLIGATELTAFYFNTFEDYPSVVWQHPFTNQWDFQFFPVMFAGVTADRPLPLPGAVAEYLPIVARTEAVYANHQPFADFNAFADPSGVRFSDTLDTMYALDLDQAYAPWLTSTGNLSANIEVQDYITLDASGNMMTGGSPWGGVGGSLTESVNKNEVNVLLNIGTSWWWEDFAPTFTGIYNPKGKTILLFPSLVLNPPWTKKYFLKLQAIEVMGGDYQSIGGGLLKGESLLTAQFQYNFNLL